MNVEWENLPPEVQEMVLESQKRDPETQADLERRCAELEARFDELKGEGQ